VNTAQEEVKKYVVDHQRITYEKVRKMSRQQVVNACLTKQVVDLLVIDKIEIIVFGLK